MAVVECVLLLFECRFEAALRIQKDTIREEKRFAREEARSRQADYLQRQEELQTKFDNEYAMLNDMIQETRCERDIRKRAQTQAASKLERDIRAEMRQRLQLLKDNMASEEDRLYAQEDYLADLAKDLKITL
eukprot:GCRY01008507.1.p1 GENE.GCRY01008507.1~~GCRY01008507.1.p1  ORF type:complete len:132 (-),score=35.63 GCRY01008507.1:453-848(-)